MRVFGQNSFNRNVWRVNAMMELILGGKKRHIQCLVPTAVWEGVKCLRVHFLQLRISTSLYGAPAAQHFSGAVGGDTASQSYCSGLSNTVSGRIEIFSFLSGQLYSFGSLDWKTGTCLRTAVQKRLFTADHYAFKRLPTSSRILRSWRSPSMCSTNSSVRRI